MGKKIEAKARPERGTPNELWLIVVQLGEIISIICLVDEDGTLGVWK